VTAKTAIALAIWPARDSYHLSELRRLTALGIASLQRELNRLVESQLVQSTRVDNLRCFQANPQSPVYTELVVLTRKTMGAAPLLMQALQPMTANIRTAFIFGSMVKGTDTANSDMDVLLGDGLALSDILQLLLSIETSLGRKINPTCYTPSEYAKRLAEPDSFVNRILVQRMLDMAHTRLADAQISSLSRRRPIYERLQRDTRCSHSRTTMARLPKRKPLHRVSVPHPHTELAHQKRNLAEYEGYFGN